MSQNSLLEAPFASDRQAGGSYHSGMDGNGQLRQAPAPPQWHQPYQAGPALPYPPAAVPTSNRRWIPAAIISAGLLVAGAVVGGAVIMNHSTANPADAPAGQSVVAATPGALDSSTCKAWPITRKTLGMIPALPAGWDWNTPNIDTYIGNLARSTETALQLFVPKIAPEPTEVAATANDFVAGKRQEIRMLVEHTYTAADGVAANDAGFRLNQLCGLPD